MPSELTAVLVRSAAVITVMMTLVWGLSLWRRDVSIVDIAWGMGFVLIAWSAFLWGADKSAQRWLLPLMVTVWGVRLSGYLFWRNHGKPEDYRYRSMREHWGGAFPIASLVIVFGLQGVVMWVVALPLQVGIASADQQIVWLALAGLIVWGTGLSFEAVGDWQLAHFRSVAENQGRLLDAGLWRYTRHPNYFGDFLVWWGFYLVAVAQSGAWWTVIGPLAMSVFLMKVSGVTLLEKKLSSTKPGYQEYVARTNAFFPGLPQRK
ncbi:DUF1295 domain-containing protein [Blastopirellula marina]|nr:DUF1295 domain-containing protein [Blastopirellula marina]